MDISGRTKIYGIIGHPIEHTLSPRLHNAVFQKRGVDAVYLPFQVDPLELPMAIEGMKALNIQGLNITLPHKEQALHYVDVVPMSVDQAIGAINTVVIQENQVMGFNTDGLGFLKDLRERFQFDPTEKTVLVLGAGGSARAVAFSLLKLNCARIYVYNRTIERAENFANHLKQYAGPDQEVHVLFDALNPEFEHLDLLVNCTSCGMKESDPFPVVPDVLPLADKVYDLIYSPAETKLLAEAKRLGKKTANGLGMLLQQAVIAHSLWFPDADKVEIESIMKEAYKEK